ncbi:MAG: hypothetical protein ABIP90_03655, partial [Vicinamibacterales bacterium]
MSASRRVRCARALFEALIRLAPPATRRDYGDEMRDTFNALSERADAGGFWPIVRLLGRETLDLLRARRPAATMPLHLEGKSAMAAWMDFFAPLAQPLQLLRALTRRPLFTLAVTATLAFGIGTSTTLFSVVETVLLRPLPYPDG